jgi:hypothetical protein
MINIQAIADRTKLVTLTTTSWRATKAHKPETLRVNETHHTQRIAKVTVKLCESAALTTIGSIDSAAYLAHRRLTMPSMLDGMRLLPAGREMEHSKLMQEFAGQRSVAQREFAIEYPALRASAPQRLNGLYDPTMWPDSSAIAEKFSFATRYMSTPTEGAWSDWLLESARAGQEEIAERLRDALTRVATRVGTTDGKLFQTVFTDLRDLCALVPDFNLLDDPTLTHVASLAADGIAQYNADTVRADTDARTAIAERARQLCGMLNNGATL